LKRCYRGYLSIAESWIDVILEIPRCLDIGAFLYGFRIIFEPFFCDFLNRDFFPALLTTLNIILKLK